jgi:hypothetical protein
MGGISGAAINESANSTSIGFFVWGLILTGILAAVWVVGFKLKKLLSENFQ